MQTMHTQVCLLKRAWAFYMKDRTVSMLRIRRKKTRAFDRHSVNKAYTCGIRMSDMGLG